MSEYFQIQNSQKLAIFTIYLHDKNQKYRHTFTKNHDTSLQKLRQLLMEITATSYGNHLEKCWKSPRKVAEILRKTEGNHVEKLKKTLGKIRSKC